MLTVLIIPITDQEPGSSIPGCGFTELLGSPCVGGGSCDGSMHNAASLKFDDHENVQRPKEQIMDHSEVTSPDLGCMVL